MVINNFSGDLGLLLRQEGKRQEDVASELGITREAISTRARGNVVNKGYVEVVETLGYDIVIKYVKRD